MSNEINIIYPEQKSTIKNYRPVIIFDCISDNGIINNVEIKIGKYNVNIIDVEEIQNGIRFYAKPESLPEGEIVATISFVGENQEKVEKILSFYVAYEPTIIFLEPLEHETTHKLYLPVKVKCISENPNKIIGRDTHFYVDNVMVKNVEFSEIENGFLFSFNQTMEKGNHYITVRCSTNSGYFTEKIKFFSDPIFLSATTSIKNGDFIGTSKPDIYFTLTKVGGYGVSSVYCDGFYSEKISETETEYKGVFKKNDQILSDGENEIILYFKNSLMNETVVKLDFIVDTSPPELEILYPIKTVKCAKNILKIIGNANDSISGISEVKIDGDIVSNNNGRFNCKVNLSSGMNTFSVVAKNRAGLESSVIITAYFYTTEFEEPKTDWSENDYFNISDIKRIVDNLFHIQELSCEIKNGYDLFWLKSKRTYYDLIFADDFNTIYENIEIIANNVPDVNKPSIVFFKENTPTITFKQLNEIEKYIKDVYVRLLEEKKLIKRLSFTLGNNSEIK